MGSFEVTMRLKRFAVSKLFGIFDHEVNLRLEDGITIIHAPNGYGKTVVLRLINGFFSGSMKLFRDIEFSTVDFEFTDGETVRITQIDLPMSDPRSPVAKGYRVELINGDAEAEAWEPFAPPEEGSDRRRILPTAIERFVPHLDRIGPREWRDMTSNDRLNFDEVIDRYWHLIPENYRANRGGPEWLRAIRSSVDCQLIETQRLLAKREGRPHERDSMPKPTVSAYRDALKARMEAILAESATSSQSLDRTFPNRLLTRMRDRGDPLSEQELRERLSNLEGKRARLTAVDLLAHSDDSALISDEKFDKATRRILTEYVIDTEKKLQAYDDILDRIELFVDLLNDKLNFKTVRPKRDVGFEIRDVKGRIIEPNDLSSGEQHELVLFFDLIFGQTSGKLLLIDEPEISLHIAWQKRFLPDLERIISISPMDVVISTHSPQLISHYRHLMETFRRPNV